MEETSSARNLDLLRNMIDNNKLEDDYKIINILSKIGRMPSDTNYDLFIELLNSKNAKIRVLAIKNLAKLSKYELITVFKNIIQNDNSSEVRREATSAIGRLRNSETIQYLMELTDDYDPEVILQALRGLSVYKNRKDIRDFLDKFKNHNNELIRDFIYTELQQTYQKRNKNFQTETIDLLSNSVIEGNVLEIMDYIPDESIHLTFTSPPYYNARDYSIYRSYKEYLDFLQKTFLKIYRITKEGRFLVVNTSPIIIPRASRQHSSKRYPIPFDLHPILSEIGWEFIDDIIWVKPEASVKNRVAGFDMHRKPLAYKPNPVTEYVMVYRKKTEKLIDWNIRNYSWNIIKESKVEDGYETTNVWNIDPVFDKVHSAVFPIELCKRIIKYYSYVGDIVFDPFAGSGTVGKASILLNRKFLLTEIQKSYIERIKTNLNQISILSPDINIKYMNLDEFKIKMENKCH